MQGVWGVINCLWSRCLRFYSCLIACSTSVWNIVLIQWGQPKLCIIFRDLAIIFRCLLPLVHRYCLTCFLALIDAVTRRRCWIAKREMFKVSQRLPQIHVSDHSLLIYVAHLDLPNLKSVISDLWILLDYMGRALINSVSLGLPNFFVCFREGLGEAYDGDIAFASSLETFGGGHNDPISVAFGG